MNIAGSIALCTFLIRILLIGNARRLGVPPGGDIFIHGLPNGYGFVGAAHRARDWTDGCVAVTDQEIEEIWTLVDNDTPVEIRPWPGKRDTAAVRGNRAGHFRSAR